MTDPAQIIPAGEFPIASFGWLYPDNVEQKANKRVLLVEIWPYDPSGEEVIRMGFSSGTMTPFFDGFFWTPRLKSSFSFQSTLFNVDMSPSTRQTPSFNRVDVILQGVLSFPNDAGGLYDITTLEWGGRRVRLLVGTQGDSYADLTVLLDGKIEDTAWTEEVLSFEIYDKGQDLVVPVQENTFAGDDSLGEGGSDLTGALQPLCYGLKRNIEPIQVDSATRIYRFHEGSSEEVIGVFDKGVELTNAGDISDLSLPAITNWTPLGGYFVTDLSKSLIRLGAEPAGMVTCDVKGDNTGGYVQKIGEIIERVLETKGGISSSDIDDTTLAAFNSSVDYACGVYLTNGPTINTLISQWLHSVNAFWYVDREGKFQIKELGFTTSLATLGGDSLLAIEKKQTIAPMHTSRVGYRVLGVEQDLGSLVIPLATDSAGRNLLGNDANATQVGEFTYADKVSLSSWTGRIPDTISAGVWFEDPTSNVSNMRVQMIFYDASNVQVGDPYEGNYVVGAATATRSVVEGISPPSGATKVTIRTEGDSNQGDVLNTYAMLNEGSVALPFSPGGVFDGIVNFNSRNDRDGTSITTPTIAADGSAIDHTVNTDGSVDISLEWLWAGDNSDIDGWIIWVYSASGSGSYNFGDSASLETRRTDIASARYFFLKGVPADRYYTFGVQAYRIVDPDVNSSEIITTSIIQPSLGSEDPYLPSANVAFAGDVTGTIDSVDASVVAAATGNFNTRNDRDDSAITDPTISGSGTAIDHTTSSDSSANISFEWSWGGDEEDIDGFLIFVRQSTSGSSYNFGTTPAQETITVVPADRRAFFLYGVAVNEYYTFGVQAYRVVDPDVDSDGVIFSSLVQPALGSEDPYRPSSSVSFNGDVTGTVDGTDVADVVAGAANPRPTIALVLNESGTGTANSGEATCYGLNPDGTLNKSANGFVYGPDDSIITIARDEYGSGSGAVTFVTGTADTRGYLVYDSGTTFDMGASGSGNTAFVFKQDDGLWYYDNNTTTPQAYSPGTTAIALGWLVTGGSSDAAVTGGLFGSAVRLLGINESDLNTPYIKEFAVSRRWAGTDTTERSLTTTVDSWQTIGGASGLDVTASTNSEGELVIQAGCSLWASVRDDDKFGIDARLVRDGSQIGDIWYGFAGKGDIDIANEPQPFYFNSSLVIKVDGDGASSDYNLQVRLVAPKGGGSYTAPDSFSSLSGYVIITEYLR